MGEMVRDSGPDGMAAALPLTRSLLRLGLSILAVGTAGGSGLTELYGPTPLQAAAEAGVEALRGGTLTEFESRRPSSS